MEPQRSVKHDWLDRVLDERGRLDGYAVAVATGLWKHMNRAGVCFPSVRLLADEAKVAKSTVESRIKMLEAAGFLSVNRRPQGANTYSSVLPDGTDQPSVLPDGTDGRQRRRGAPSVLRDGGSVPCDDLSVLSGQPSVLPERSSVLPGRTEHVNPVRGEHVNPGALSGGAPEGALALGADPVDEVKLTPDRIRDILAENRVGKKLDDALEGEVV